MSEKTLSRIEDKIDRVNDRLDGADLRLLAIEKDLASHIRRTELLEESVELVRAEVKPLTESAAMWAGAGKLMAILGSMAGAVAALFKIFGS